MMSSPADRWARAPGEAMSLVAVLAAMALVVLDAAMLNVALPTMAMDLQVSPATSVSLVTVYQTAVVMALLPCAALGESLGNRRVFRAGLALFVAASAFAAWAPSLTWLAVARFLQGIGGGAIMALGIALLRQALPASRIGAAIAWNALTVALCSAAAPTLGAIIVSLASWRWLFLIELPVGLVAMFGSLWLPTAAGTGRKLDLASVALGAGGFLALISGLQSLPARPLLACLLMAASVLGFVTLVRRESPKPSPQVPIDLLRDRAFRLAVLASICCFAGQTAGMVALPFYLQQTLGETALMTGLYMTPWPMAVALAALVSGRLADRLPAAWLCTAGAGLLAMGLAGAALVPLSGNPLVLAALTIPCGLGFGLFQVPNNRTMFLSAPLERSAAAGGLQGTARLTGQACGAVVMALLFVWAPFAAAPKLGLAIGGIAALAAALVSAAQIWPRAGSPLPAWGGV